MPDTSNENTDSGLDPVLLVAVILAVVLIIVIIVLIMCWKIRNRKQESTNGAGNIILTNPNPEDGTEKIALAKSKLTPDPFMLDAGNLLKGEDRGKFDELVQQLQGERIKFLVILNSLRRDAKTYTSESEAFYTYRECIHELSRFLYLVNRSPEGSVPDDGLYLAHWAKQILAIYDNEHRIIAIPYNQYDMGEEEEEEGFPIQQLRASMRARRSSLGSSEESSLNDSAIRVDIESEDEEEEIRNSSEVRNSLDHQHNSTYGNDVIVNPNSFEESSSDSNIIAAPLQFSKINAEYY